MIRLPTQARLQRLPIVLTFRDCQLFRHFTIVDCPDILQLSIVSCYGQLKIEEYV
jgi:hypothetical protein